MMGGYRASRFESLDKPVSRVHRWLGHQQIIEASGPSVDGWQAFDVYCSCDIKFRIVR